MQGSGSHFQRTGLINEAIELAGGMLDASHLPAVIPPDLFAQIEGTNKFLQGLIDRVFREDTSGRPCQVRIVVARSEELACRVRQVSEDCAVILIPIGALARTYVLSHLLLRFWNKESRILVVGSPVDDIPREAWALPPRLAPVFGAQVDDEQSYWEQIYSLDQSLELDPRFEPDSRELLHLVQVLLVLHEFAHVYFRHAAYLAHIRKTSPGHATRALRGMESGADWFAGLTAMQVFLAQVRADRAVDTGRIAVGFLRMSYAQTMVFAITDTNRKFAGAYDEGAYNHPLVRRELCKAAASHPIETSWPHLTEPWEDNELEGWRRCYLALQDLNLECMRGTFGETPSGKLVYPLQAMVYPRADAGVAFMENKLQEAFQLLSETNAALNAFCQA